MANSLNKAVLIGKIVSDPVITQNDSGKKTAKFSIKTYQSWVKSNLTHNVEEEHKIVIFNDQIINNITLEVGDHVYLEGMLQRSTWMDESNNKKFSYEISITQFSGMISKLSKDIDLNSTLNKFCAIGNLGQDAQCRQTNAGKSVVSLSMATSQKWRNHMGEMQERTDWHNVSIFNDHLINLTKDLSKGTTIYIEGIIKKKDREDKKTGLMQEGVNIVLNANAKVLIIKKPHNFNAEHSSNDENNMNDLSF